MEYRKKAGGGGLRSSSENLLRAFVLLLAVACVCVPAAAQTTEFMELVSVNAAGTQAGNGQSFGPRLSDDGRFVMFTSEASDLVANDNNNATDVFVRDLQTNTTTLVSVNSAGNGSGNRASFSPVMTPDGRFVMFASNATDLVANDAD